MKIGLLGGSFNPPHHGHLYIGSAAKKRFDLDQIWLLPTKQNPLKNEINSDFDLRLELCKKLIQNSPNFLVKDYEKNLKSNFTIDLVKKITKKYPAYQFFWIMGSDSLINFHLWKDWQKIMQLTPPIIIDRENNFHLAKNSKAWNFATKIGVKKSNFLKIKKIDISSTKIRNQNV
jgi:nicotinate-nucleotide adenylyltransferase